MKVYSLGRERKGGSEGERERRREGGRGNIDRQTDRQAGGWMDKDTDTDTDTDTEKETTK